MIIRPIYGAAVLLAVSFVAGSLSPSAPPQPRERFAGGYQVLSGDFHVHSFPLSWGVLSPFDTVLEARRQGLDIVAMSGHNTVIVAKAGRWFSRLIGGPTVMVSEEVHSPRYHMIAVGIERTVSWNQPAAAAVDDVHRQGGVAIVAHPVEQYWPGWDSAAMARVDAAEVVHPVVFDDPKNRRELRQFFARRKLTAIGSSDFHESPSMGLCRTWVFVTENSERGVLEALRRGHTVVYDFDGAVFGDPDLIRLNVVPKPTLPQKTFWDRVSMLTGLWGLLVAAAVLRH